MIDFRSLKAPFPPELVSWRVGSITKDKSKGMALAYIDARDVMNRLDDVCGPEHWSALYPHAGAKTVCEIGINVTKQYGLPKEAWVWKADGAGDSDFEAEKGALSDAFKRAAVRWGIGRYLYDIKSPWVKIDDFKHIMPDELTRLERLLPNAPEDGLKVHGLSGQSKQPAKFWSNDSLALQIPQKHVNNLDAGNSWLIEQFRNAIDKAPTRDILAKLQMDNSGWIDNLEATKTHELYEACSVRATQFDMEGT